MSPPRRRSARLAGGTPAKPKAVPELAGVLEAEEPPVVTASATPKKKTSNTAGNAVTTDSRAPTTPKSATHKPSNDEMHPSKFQNSIAPPSSGLRLGFTDIKSPRTRDQTVPAGVASTPTKINNVIPSTDFTFSVAKSAANVELSDEAKQLMQDLRGRAAQIKADLVAHRESGMTESETDRKIAQPKAKAGRFSAAHMAEFKKMDSIENHPSLWRAQHWTPIGKDQLKRSPSKPDLDGTPKSAKTGLKRSPSKAQLEETPKMKSGVKRKSSAAQLGERATPSKIPSRTSPIKGGEADRRGITPFAKRLKKSQQEDVSTAGPLSLGDSCSSPRKQLKSPVKAFSRSLSRSTRLNSPAKPSMSDSAAEERSTVMLVSNATEPTSGGVLGKSPSVQSLANSVKSFDKRRILSPRSISKISSILKSPKVKSAIPGPASGSAVSQTPKPARSVNKELPPLPLTTPRRKLSKHVSFTPETKRHSGIFKSMSPKVSGSSGVRFNAGVDDMSYVSMDGVLAAKTHDQKDVVYPDLTSLEARLKESAGTKEEAPVPSVPGSFTFRTDHTIEFGGPASPAGFGGHPGQSSVRHVRRSVAPGRTKMPGGFPAPPSPTSHPDKENAAPSPNPKGFFGISHGMSNKKRHRVSSDEEDAVREEAERAAKKRKEQHVPEGHAVVAPQLMTTTPKGSVKKMRLDNTPKSSATRTPTSVTPSRKRPVLSMSRLNALARPKQRT